MEGSANALAVAAHLLDTGQPERALRTLDDVGGGELENSFFWHLRALALHRLDRPAEAARAAREGLELDPDSVLLLDVLSLSAAQLGDLDEAETAILAALRLEPDDPELLAHYAHLLARGGVLDKARRVLERAERVDPDSPDVTGARIALAYVSGDDAEARRQSERMLRDVDPEDPRAHSMIGLQYAQRGSYGHASRHFDTAARADLTDASVVDTARHGRALAHWLLVPMRPIERFGPGPIWIAWIATFGVLTALGLDTIRAVAIVLWLVYVVYSWVVAPLALRWLRRRAW